MPKIEKDLLNRLNLLLNSAKHVVIVSHMNADGDAVGSILGAMHLISQHYHNQKQLQLVLPNGCPRTFAYLPSSHLIMNGDVDLKGCQEALRNADLILGVDFNNAPRIDQLANDLVASTAKKVLIDHHHTPDTELFDLVISDPNISSACELVYWTFAEMWGKDCLTQTAAKCLYNGICTDTGSYAFSNEHPSVYEASAELVKMDIGAAEIHNRIDNTFTIERMQFWGYAINNLLHINREHKWAYFMIPLAEMNKFGVSGADLEGLVSYTLKMEEIEVGALIREEKDRVKVSLRSKYDVDVNKLAREHLGGGGHTKASGATIVGMTLQEVEQKLNTIITNLK